ncbi:hypothetical protein SAMN05443633_11344 [Chryseobacterium arachidis]|uniref:Uncharacterized protein n=2 Tax=Chryseobacterium arachidis TaxID=1416778 RepID=A0A1M5IRD8_9FLAO|nr:hypothetical protein [Chryseobacterium arachidis]SHG30831.1 hypothetical protein SAMN05443633_11344 [Chryseobacterium arachidis]
MKINFKSISLLIAISLSSTILAQKRTEDFTISLPAQKADKSYYKTITVIDNRMDTTSIGIVQQGALNAKARVVPTSPLSSQFQSVLNSVNGENTENGSLVLYLKQLYFAEVSKAFTEFGYCYFQGFLFAKNENGTYSLLEKTDTVVDHKDSDVTKDILRKGSEMLGQFIAKNVSKKPETTEQYTFDQIKKFDDIDKQSISLFNSSQLKDGVYKDYASLKNQQPQQEITNAKFYGNMPKIVRIYETADGKEKEIKKDDIYAIVYKGELYIYLPIENLFTKAEKRDNDYYFVGKLRSGGLNMGNVGIGMFFGAMGVLLASNPAYPFEQKIDYINGAFIPIKEIQSKKY